MKNSIDASEINLFLIVKLFLHNNQNWWSVLPKITVYKPTRPKSKVYKSPRKASDVLARKDTLLVLKFVFKVNIQLFQVFKLENERLFCCPRGGIKQSAKKLNNAKTSKYKTIQALSVQALL